MKKITHIFVGIIILTITAQFTFAQQKNFSDKDIFLKAARFLETNPFDKKAKDAREWGFRYLVETKDVSVTLCSDMMNLIPEKKNKYKSELTMQFTFGMGVFKLENPDQKDDESAAQLAGIESMLRSYEAMRSEKSKAQNDELDALVTKRDKGELKALVDAVNCDEEESK